MVDLVRHDDGSGPVHLRKIAEDNDLSHGYLEQLMISLRNAALVRGLSGRKGGYVLARPAEEITLTEIVEAAIGPINVVDCVNFPENCKLRSKCTTRPIWVLINHAVRDVLDNYTLAQLAEDNWLEKITRKLAAIADTPVGERKVFRRGSRRSRHSPGLRTPVDTGGATACGRPSLPNHIRHDKAGKNSKSKKTAK